MTQSQNHDEQARSKTGGKTLPTHDATGRKKTPQQTKGFAADTAEKTGMSKRSINLSLSRANAIPRDVLDQITRTHLDKGVYLDILKKMSPDDQRAKVRADLATPKNSKIVEPQIKQFENLKRTLLAHDRCWANAGVDAISMFEAWLREQSHPLAGDDGGGDA